MEMVTALERAHRAFVPHTPWVVNDERAQVKVLHAGMYRFTAVPSVGLIQYGLCGIQETEVFYDSHEFYRRLTQVLHYRGGSAE